MSLIHFNNASENVEVILSLDTLGRTKVIFSNDAEIPEESTLISGFVELNEHNFIEQSDFSDMNYIYQKIDNLTYILTRNKDDVYTEPEISNENNQESIPEYTPTISEVKSMKISSLSSICNQKIVNGVDINIDGTTEHFSYTEEDQTNIKELFDLALQTNVSLYYHSDNNSCKLYTVEQIIELYTSSVMNKMHQITYFNQLKMYLSTLEDIDAINAIEYGYPLEGKFLETYNAAMSQAKFGMETLLKMG